MSLPDTMREMRTLVTADGQLQLSLAHVPVPAPAAGEVLVQVQGAPINPSDLALLVAMADITQAVAAGTAAEPLTTAPVPERVLAGLQGRVGQSLPVGNEGCGVVVAAGAAPEAQALLGKVVAFVGGASYAEYRNVPAMMCLPLPDGTTPQQGASSFVNPLTALGFIETMKLDGHTAMVHTAAASNLGQMLVRICQEDGIELVNIVRKPEQEALLRSLGATYVVDSSSPTFRADLIEALRATDATLAFDAIGGGRLGGQILSCMEAVASSTLSAYNRYGSDVYKQLYIYGMLDPSPTELVRNFGFSWGVCGWLLTPFLGKIGLEGLIRMRDRVVAGLTTTFASHYAGELTLAGALAPEAIRTYGRMATGEKYLIRPDL
jgi:NADPH:quinone reductase-like Zn-dependent oxidoreductase